MIYKFLNGSLWQVNEKRKNFRKVNKHCRRTSEGSSLSFIKLNEEPATMYHAAPLFCFLFHLYFTTLFYSWISSLSINVVDFNSLPFPVWKVKITQVLLEFSWRLFVVVIWANLVSGELWFHPLYAAVRRRDLSSPCSFLTFPQVQESHSGLSQLYYGQISFA